MAPSCQISQAAMIIATLLLLTGLSSSEPSRRSQRAHDGTSLILNVLRTKRFDFHIFECPQCHPSIQCHTDSMCTTKYGHDYKCMFECCELKCVRITKTYHETDDD